MWSTWLWGCNPPDIDAEIAPSAYVPAAFRVSWSAPAGHARVEVADGLFGEWRTASEGDFEAGPAELGLALLPPGHEWRWRVRVDTGRRELTSAVGDLEIPEPPAELGGPSETLADPDAESSRGYWIGYHYGNKAYPEDSAPMVLDGDGVPVWWVEPRTDGSRPIRVRPSRDRRSILVLVDHEDPEKRFIVRWALDGSARTVTTAADASHDFWENGDGTFTYVAYRFDGDVLVPGQPGPSVVDTLRTVPEGATDPAEGETGFDVLEDYPVAPWHPCEHADYGVFVPNATEWTHANSLIRSPRDDGWLVTMRFVDAVLGVDDAGALAWQAGGRDSTLARLDDRAQFEHGHSSDAWEEDDGIHLLMFDNGDHTPSPIVSRVVELRIDPEHGSYDSVWDLPDPKLGFTGFLGDAQRLPGGNTLVVWTGRGELVEFAPDGEAVRVVRVEGELGRGFWAPSLSLDPVP